MTQITERNVNHALTTALILLRSGGVPENSRNGRVLVMPGPVCTSYTAPTQRVLFNPRRDANHVFHLMEAIWMLAGQSKVEWLLQFNSKFGQFAEEDGTMHGAYGMRWSNYFEIDQIEVVIGLLQKDKETRQAVIGMWDPMSDLGADVKDKPCNTHIYFDCRFGRLNMTVCCRSNDVIWGAYGSNVVHFSMLQELIAYAVELPVGVYRQFSNNFHIYTDLPVAAELLENPHTQDRYWMGDAEVVPMLDESRGETWQDFLRDCETMVHAKSGVPEYATKFMNTVAEPLRLAYLRRKQGMSYEWAFEHTNQNCDWLVAFREWVGRREEKNVG